MTHVAIEDRGDVERALDAVIPSRWRATRFKDFLPLYLRQLERQLDEPGWGIWLIVHRQCRSLVGDVGFGGPPDERGEVEIAFTVMDRFRGRGYASEAVTALAEWALGQARVEAVVASCDPLNVASRHVLTRAGFRLTSETLEAQRWRREEPP